MSSLLKRRNSSNDSERAKRPRVDSRNGASLAISSEQRSVGGSPSLTTPSQPEQVHDASDSRFKGKGKGRLDHVAVQNTTQGPKTMAKPTPRPERREKFRKLAPPRPFPTLPISMSASGPKSAHKDGKNLICITRHTPLAAYLSRCKKLLVDEGYKTLHLHAMGAAIPHLLTLSVSLPPILPFNRDKIKIDVCTGTIEVMDEVIPEDEDEDMSLRTRGKGGVSVMIQVGDGEVLGGAKNARTTKRTRGKGEKSGRQVVVVPEQEQDDDEMDQDEEYDDGEG